MPEDGSEGPPCLLKLADFFCAGVGCFMVVVGGMKYYDHYENLSLGQFVTNFYSIVLGLLVMASALGWQALIHRFGFTAHFIGRGFFYLFIGVYFTTVTTGGIKQAFDTLSDIDRLLPLIAGITMLITGIVFVFMHICPCYQGCCKDGNFLDAVVISDMGNTAMKQQKLCCDRVMRGVSMLAGGFLVFGAYEIFKLHFNAKFEDMDVSLTTLVYLIDAIYALVFGLTVLASALEFAFFITSFAFLSRPLGKGLYYIFIAVYFMGAGRNLSFRDFKRIFTTSWEAQLPFIAGAALGIVGLLYIFIFLFPCVGGCCSDKPDEQWEIKQQAKSIKTLKVVQQNNPTAADI